MSRTPTWSNPNQFDHLLLEPVHVMMRKGIKIDQEKKTETRVKTIESWYKQQEILDKIVGGSLNVSGKKVLTYLLYTDLKMPKHLNKGKLTTNEEALRSIMAECRYQVANLQQDHAIRRWMEGYLVCRYVLNIRRVRKEISSYLGLNIEEGKLAGEVPFEDEDGRIRGKISVGGTKTGRFSHAKTAWDTGINLATVPRYLRDLYIPDEGYEFAEFDLNRGESWIYAHLSEDPELLRIHTGGLDFHAETGAIISGDFSKDGKERSVEWIEEHLNNQQSEFYNEAFLIRYVAKRVNHATSYGMREVTGAKAINEHSDETGIAITPKEFKKARERWLAKYFMIEGWWRDITSELNRSRTMVTPYGRKITVHDRINDKTIRDMTAWVPQATSVQYLNQGFLKVHYEYVDTGAWGMSVLAQNHDSLLCQYKIEDRDEAIPLIAKALTSTITIKGRTFSIPIEAKYGTSWFNTKKYKLPSL